MRWTYVTVCVGAAIFAGITLNTGRIGMALTIALVTICCAIDGAAEGIKKALKP